MSTKAGAFIAAASAEANFGVTVRWAGKAEETPVDQVDHPESTDS